MRSEYLSRVRIWNFDARKKAVESAQKLLKIFKILFTFISYFLNSYAIQFKLIAQLYN